MKVKYFTYFKNLLVVDLLQNFREVRYIASRNCSFIEYDEEYQASMALSGYKKKEKKYIKLCDFFIFFTMNYFGKYNLCN